MLSSATVQAQEGRDCNILGKFATDRLISQIAVSPNSGKAYGISPLGKTVTIFDLDPFQAKRKVSLVKKPAGLTVDPGTHRVYITANGPIGPVQSGSIYVLDSGGQLLNNLSLSKTLQGLALDPVAETLTVAAEEEKKLIILSLPGLSRIREIPLPYRPQRICLDPGSDRALVTAKEHGWSITPTKLLILDLTTGALLQELTFPKGIRGLAVAPEKEMAVAANREAIFLIDINHGTLISTIRPGIPIFEENKTRDGDLDVDLFFGVDINQATLKGIISGEGGFVLLDLETFTARACRLEGGLRMRAVAVDRYSNTLLGSYWKWGFPLPLEKGVVKIQLPNPLPEIFSLSPSEGSRGGEEKTITLEGKGFIESSESFFNNQALPSVFVDNHRLLLPIPKEMFSQGGVFPVKIFNPEPQGGMSNRRDFLIKNPTPTISVLDPGLAPAGTQTLQVNLSGSGFLPETTVSLLGRTRSIRFFSDASIEITLTAADMAQSGVLEVVASNPGPGGGSSRPMGFTVTNPLPVLSSLSPNSVNAGSGGFTLDLYGANFAPGAAVTLNGNPIAATWIDSGRLKASVPAEAVRAAGSFPVVVTNPPPSGGPSAPLILLVTGASTVAPLPNGSYGKQYEDLIPSNATILAYDPKRFSLITGQVKDQAGEALTGVKVGIHGRPEYGSAQTDISGRFSLPLDGGGTVTLTYQKASYLTAHRQVEAPWNGIVGAETVVMVPEDSKATAVTFDGNQTRVITHTSTTVDDVRGPRGTTLVFSGDNQALVKDALGNEQPLNNITVRATEYITPNSMPAKLPPNSAYTYCAELSVDGAKSVRFQKPVVMFVDNFLNFRVGEIVPVGYYDRERAVWAPVKNGVVVKLLDTNNDGIVDAYTDDQNPFAASHPAPGLTDNSRFKAGMTFWRVELTHFSPWDCNWPYGPPSDAIARIHRGRRL